MESKLIEEGTSTVAALYPYYDRLKARDYANTWTSNKVDSEEKARL
ncbi:hypothetical protein [Caldanaerobacter subterraneus]|jgi:RNA polymerase sigma-70 factor (ECF subfamily)|uniref:Uncharacterized protein n=1 Tax=Caldanaerobacter subterraneus subsp. pacificus DSM 12653 TaxID=391606 RepID=A0A0F5PP94_9THEO|nr:hypothetical protein [Caldanaerobacter subterraneus]KKC30492.1 hypothetical protein CDSM653_00446 [Caldanaerobacter subterraneus subsp. pacificus DSM 12653]